MFEISVKSRFSAAHHLKGYDGSCASLHGHNWEVEVFLRGETLSDVGILMDFRRLKEVLRELLGELDHADLNTVEAFRTANPSSENLARYLYRGLAGRLDSANCRVHRVSVCETPESRATYWEEGLRGA